MHSLAARWALFFSLASVFGCVARYERPLAADLRARAVDFAAPTDAPTASLAGGSVRDFTVFALRHSPALRASFYTWKADLHRIAQARSLPEPTFTYGYFIQSVETKTGPQRHRFGLSQRFPWPTKLTAGADAAAARARASQRVFEHRTLDLRARVARAYWHLWETERLHTVQSEELALLETLAEALRARVETGRGELADLAQTNLRLIRLTDEEPALLERATAQRAALAAVVGYRGTMPPALPTTAPQDALPSEEPAAPPDDLAEHPSVAVETLLAESAEARERAARAQRFPGFGVGLDFIETGPAGVPGTPGSGEDPIILSLSIQIPLWQHVYAAAEEQARAERDAAVARREAALDTIQAGFRIAHSRLRDARRRVGLYRDTLLPEALNVLEAVRAGYEAGTTEIAGLLMAESELFALRRSLLRAHREQAVAAAELSALSAGVREYDEERR